MSTLIIRDMLNSDHAFVHSCGHFETFSRIKYSSRSRIAWLNSKHKNGLRTKVVILDGKQAGFIHIVPAEIMPFGLFGSKISVIPCMALKKFSLKSGIGKTLVHAAEHEAKLQGSLGIAVIAYYHHFWFMPASFFEKLGFKAVRRKGDQAILWKLFEPKKKPPKPFLLKANYTFKPIKNKTVVDVFWMSFCGSDDLEVAKKVAAKYKNQVIIREFCSDNRNILRKYQIPRAVYINGKQIEWDYANPEEGFEKAVLTNL